MARRLTLKRKKFVKEYIANGGNGTQAALVSHNAKTPQSAGEMASKILKNVEVQNEIEKTAGKNGLSLKRALRNIRKMANIEPENVSAKVILNANLTIMKYFGALSGPEKANVSFNFTQNVENMNYKDIIKSLQGIDKGIKHLLTSYTSHSK